MTLATIEPGTREPTLSTDAVFERVDYLVNTLHTSTASTKLRTRSILDGGADAIRALLGDSVTETTDLIPIPPLMHSGMRRLGQKIGGRIPDLKIDPYGYKDSQASKAHAEKTERIIDSWDGPQGCRLRLQFPQVGRWLAGYGYAMWIIRDRRRPDGTRFPYAAIRDPFDVYPGTWTVDQQPYDAASIQQLSVAAICRMYPEKADEIREKIAGKRPRTTGGAVLLRASNTTGTATWGNQAGDGLQVVEYWYPEGTFVLIPELHVVLGFDPNPLYPLNRFVIPKRFSFNKLAGHYDHIIGLMATMARIQILEYIFLEDSVNTETNIAGESLEGDVYRKGRNAVNRLAQGTQVTKPVNNLQYQHFQGVDRMERLLRIGASYPVTDDGQHPGGGWATGAGLQGLRADVDEEVKEYHNVLEHATQDLDYLRLMWDEIRNAGETRTVYGYRKGAAYAETYDPAEHRGRYLTRRVHGVMAGWDEPSKIVTGLQLVQGEVIDIETMQENLDGLDNITRVNERIRSRKAEDTAWGMLQNRANAPAQPGMPPDPKQILAEKAIIDIMTDPGRMRDILVKYYTEAGEQLSDEEQAFMDQQTQQQAPAMDLPSDGDITTILSRLEGSGGTAGGVQTVGRMGG